MQYMYNNRYVIRAYIYMITDVVKVRAMFSTDYGSNIKTPSSFLTLAFKLIISHEVLIALVASIKAVACKSWFVQSFTLNTT